MLLKFDKNQLKLNDYNILLWRYAYNDLFTIDGYRLAQHYIIFYTN